MTTKMLRLPALAHERAVALAQLTGRSIGAVVSEAIDRAYREAFWETVERQTAQTREHDPDSWAQYRDEVAEWDKATDSLDEDDDVPTLRDRPGAAASGSDPAARPARLAGTEGGESGKGVRPARLAGTEGGESGKGVRPARLAGTESEKPARTAGRARGTSPGGEQPAERAS